MIVASLADERRPGASKLVSADVDSSASRDAFLPAGWMRILERRRQRPGIRALIDCRRCDCQMVIEIVGIHEERIPDKVCSQCGGWLIANGAGAVEDVVRGNSGIGRGSEMNEYAPSRTIVHKTVVDDVQILA